MISREIRDRLDEGVLAARRRGVRSRMPPPEPAAVPVPVPRRRSVAPPIEPVPAPRRRAMPPLPDAPVHGPAAVPSFLPRRRPAPASPVEPAPPPRRRLLIPLPGPPAPGPESLSVFAPRRGRRPAPVEPVPAPRRRWWNPALAPAAGAPVVVQVSPMSNGVTSNPTATLSAPSTAGNLVVFFFCARASVASGPTGWGSPTASAGLGPYIYAYSKPNNAGGITVITGSIGGTARWIAWAYEISGAPAANPVEATGKTDTGGTPNGADGSGTVITRTAADLILAAVGATSTGTFAVSSGGFTIDRQAAVGATNVLAACAMELTTTATGSYKAVTSGITSECGIILAIPGVGVPGGAGVARFRKGLSALWGRVGKRQVQAPNQ